MRALIAILAALATALPGCATTSYYLQSISGQLQILGRRQDIQELLQAPGIPAPLRSQLQAVPEILRFASEQLSLPDNGSYRTFVALERPFAAWNLFATPALSLAGLRWCFPVAGCLGYRGYFSEAAARIEAAHLRAAGHDVYVGGVAAYSTLGWFKDPVLSSMLRGDRQDLAALLFHELAHQKLWLPNDTDLNEAFAETVVRIGMEKLAQTRGDLDWRRFHDRARQEDRFFELVLRHKVQLESLYASNLPAWRKQAHKHRQFAALRADYQTLKGDIGDTGRFDRWLDADLNNAKLLAVSAYRSLVPGLLQIYCRSRGLETFYGLVRRLRDCSLETRHAWVQSGGTLPECWPAKKDLTDS